MIVLMPTESAARGLGHFLDGYQQKFGPWWLAAWLATGVIGMFLMWGCLALFMPGIMPKSVRLGSNSFIFYDGGRFPAGRPSGVSNSFPVWSHLPGDELLDGRDDLSRTSLIRMRS
jgi:hypothetical protein